MTLPHNRVLMDHSFLSAFILLLLVLDPLGSLPVFIPIMRTVPASRRTWVALREVGIAFGVLFAFMFFGDAFLRLMRLSVNREITEREPHDGYLILQGGLPETAEFIRSHWK